MNVPGPVVSDLDSSALEIAELKQKDLNAVDVEGAIKQIEGTARSMGLEIAG